MTTLTALLNRPVLGADGDRVGMLEDLAVRVAGARPEVTALLVRRGRRRFLIGRDAVTTYDPSLEPSLITRAGARERAVTLDHDTLLLGRDVLDTQVVDVDGHCLERVGDVTLDGPFVTAVEIGLRPVLRRLGLARLAGRVPSETVDWPDLHLASARGHRVQLRCASAAVHRIAPADVRAVAARLPAHRAAELLAARPDAAAATPPAPEPHRRFHVMRRRRHAPA